MVEPQPVIYANPRVGPKSSTITCPSCGRQIRTEIRHEPTIKTHITALLLCWCLLCCLPYCMSSCQNTNHSCPGCKAFIGTYKN